MLSKKIRNKIALITLMSSMGVVAVNSPLGGIFNLGIQKAYASTLDTHAPTTPSTSLSYVETNNTIKGQISLTSGVDNAQTQLVSNDLGISLSTTTTQVYSNSFTVPSDAINPVLNYYVGFTTNSAIGGASANVFEILSDGSKNPIATASPGISVPSTVTSGFNYTANLQAGHTYCIAVQRTGSATKAIVNNTILKYSKLTDEEVSGVAKSQYRINGGDWIDYTAPFIFDQTGSVKIESKTIDNAGNESAITTITYNVIDYNSIINQINQNIDLMKTKISNGDSSALLTTYFNTNNLISQLPQGNVRNDLQTKLNSLQFNIALLTDTTIPTSPSITFDYSTSLFTLTQGVDNAPANTIASGVDKTLFKINNGVWHEYTGSFGLEGAYGDVTVYAKTIDKAGNESAISSKTVSVLKDVTSPNAPTINVGSDNKTVSMVAGTDPSTIDTTKVVNLTESFEGNPVFSYSGNWIKTTTPVVDGSYSLRSAVIGNSSSSTETININVPSSTGTLSFNYRVSSESNYDWLTIKIDGVQVAKVSGNNNTWYTLTKTLAQGNHVMTLTYSTDSSNLVGSNAGYIDLINLQYTGVTVPSSGIQKMQYKINNGEWQDYTGSFIPNVSGNVDFTVREFDYAGNVSSETTTTLYIENDTYQKIQQEIDTLKLTLNDLPTQDKINTAQNTLNNIITEINVLRDGTEKTILQNQVNDIQIVINQSQDLLDATKAVELAERTFDQNDVYNATILVNKLQDGTIKNNLLVRLSNVQEIIYERYANVLISTLESQDDNISTYDEVNKLIADKDIALNYVNTNIANTDAKSGFIDRLNTIQININNALAVLDATSSVELAERTFDQNDVYNATILVNKLQDGTIKNNLLVRLSNVQEIIYERYANVFITTLESQDDNISTYDEVNKLIADKDIALNYVNTNIANTDAKSGFIDRLNAIQININNALAKLKVADCEKSISQSDIDKTKEFVDLLEDGTVKQDLLNRLTYVQSVINLDSEITRLEKSLDNMNNTLINSDLSSTSTILINSLQAQLKALVNEYNTVLSHSNSLSLTDKEFLNNNIQNIKDRLEVVRGTDDAIQSIIDTLNRNYKLANGTSDYRVRITSDINLLSMYGIQIQDTIGLDNLNWLSYNKSIATVDQTGKIHILANGIEKITVYNENGIFDIFLITKK